jgi:predicted metal-dependent peptidase
LVAVDTSGSVNNGELKEFFHEVHHMHKTGSDVTVIQCDAAISDVRPYNPRNEIKLYGRGGTDFQPVIDYYNEHQHKFTCLVYFTDGECGAPENAKGKILWVLSSTSHENNELPGCTIKLN